MGYNEVSKQGTGGGIKTVGLQQLRPSGGVQGGGWRGNRVRSKSLILGVEQMLQGWLSRCGNQRRY